MVVLLGQLLDWTNSE